MQFIDKFQEVKEATRTAVSKVANGASAVTPVTSANASPITSRAALPPPEQQDQLLEPPPGTTAPQKNEEDPSGHPRSHSVSALQPNDSPSHQGKDKSYVMNSQGQGNPVDVQLKYENDRLKLALAQR